MINRTRALLTTFTVTAAAATFSLTIEPAFAGIDMGRSGPPHVGQAHPKGDQLQNPGVLPIYSRPQGKSYSQWSATWWQWALQMPATGHPLKPGGVLCNERQSGKVWFLGGTFTPSPNLVSRSCVVPSGTALFFPLINSAYFALLSDPPETRTEEFLRAAAECSDPNISVTIDGVPLKKPAQYLVRSELFDVQLLADNVFGLDETVIPQFKLSPSADFGYYLFLSPLPVGVHDIAWSATMNCPGLGGEVSQNISYHLTVAR